MAFKIVRKASKVKKGEKLAQVAEPSTSEDLEVDPEHLNSNSPVKPLKRASADDIPNYTAELHGMTQKLYLASNSDIARTYAVYCGGWWIGNIKTAGGEFAACRAEVPKDYGDLGSVPRFTPTGVNMSDGIALLMKAADIVPGTPLAPGKKPKIKLGDS